MFRRREMDAGDIIRRIDKSGCLDIMHHYIYDDTSLESLEQYDYVTDKLKMFRSNFKSSIVENLTINELEKVRTEAGELFSGLKDERDTFLRVLDDYPVEAMLIILKHYKVVPHECLLKSTDRENILTFNDQIWRHEDIMDHTAQLLAQIHSDDFKKAQSLMNN